MFVLKHSIHEEWPVLALPMKWEIFQNFSKLSIKSDEFLI